MYIPVDVVKGLTELLPNESIDTGDFLDLPRLIYAYEDLQDVNFAKHPQPLTAIPVLTETKEVTVELKRYRARTSRVFSILLRLRGS